jgi:hypothetical protein
MSTSYTTFDPHPGDWDASRWKETTFADFMTGRLADLKQMESWLAEDTVREDTLDRVDVDRPERHVSVAVHVVNDNTHALAKLNWTGLKNMVTDIVLAIPPSQIEKFDAKHAFAEIPTITDRDKNVLETKITRALKKDKGAPAVFCISLADGHRETSRILSELKRTLGRAMIRQVTRRDGVPAVEPALADGSGVVASTVSIGRRAIGLRYGWPKSLRFIVERPCGSSFSRELAGALTQVGFVIVPDPRFEGTDECAWFASRNSDHVQEVIRCIEAVYDLPDPWPEDWGDQIEQAIDEKIQQLGDVYWHAFDWKHFDPEAHAAQIRECLGFRVRWECFDQYRIGTYRFTLRAGA